MSLPLTAQNLFPRISYESDLISWLIMFFAGAVFTIFMYVMQRWMKAMDKLSESVQGLTIQSAKSREWKKAVDKEINMWKRVTNRLVDWKNKHDNKHAQCPACPITDAL